MQKYILYLSFCFASFHGFSQSAIPDPTFGKAAIAIGNFGGPGTVGVPAKKILIDTDSFVYIILNSSITKRFPDGAVDSSYGVNGYSAGVGLGINSAALQADGKIVVTGTFQSSVDRESFATARVNTDGSVDSGFGLNGLVVTTFSSNAVATSLAIQSDGKIVVTGTTTPQNAQLFTTVRYTSAGNLDTAFNSGGIVLTDFGFSTDNFIESETASAVVTTVSGKILVGGSVFDSTGNTDFAVVRYNYDGKLDSTFNGTGKVYTSFNNAEPGTANSLAIGADGKIILAGSSSPVNSSYNNFTVTRYDSTGILDTTFDSTGIKIVNIGESIETSNSLALQTDGKIVMAGSALSNSSAHNFVVIRINTNGSIDSTFNNNGIVTTDIDSSDDYAAMVAVQKDAKIVVAGYSYLSHSPTVQVFAATRYGADGTLDASFGKEGKLLPEFHLGNTTFYGMSIQNDGKVVTSGVTSSGGNSDVVVARFNNNGTIDTTFGAGGSRSTDFGSDLDYSQANTLQADGKIVVVGTSSASSVAIAARYTSAGNLDSTFGTNGKVRYNYNFAPSLFTSVAMQTGGKIIAGGYYMDTITGEFHSLLVRLNTDGILDKTFGTNAVAIGLQPALGTVTAVVQSDGKLIVSCGFIERYNSDGSVDTSFGNKGVINNIFGNNYRSAAAVLQSDGKIIQVGNLDSMGINAVIIARYNINGSVDSSFNGIGSISSTFVNALGTATSVAIGIDGRIAVGGYAGDGDYYARNFTLGLYLPVGRPDSTFGNNGILLTTVGIGSSRINSIQFFNGKLYAAGYGLFPNNDGAIVRYIGSDGGPLPISLLEFGGYVQNASVILNWKIIADKNLSGFKIQRSANGDSFSEIHFVPSAAANPIPYNYSTIDANPLLGTNFYRLQMVDVDGNFTYSNIIAVNFRPAGIFNIFPNPVDKTMLVQASGNNETAVFVIIDASGRKLTELETILNGTVSFPLDVSALPNGIYQLVLFEIGKTQTRSFIKE